MPNHRLAAAREEVVEQTGRFMGTPIDLDPTTAILLCVQVAAGHVEYATRQVADVPEEDAFVNTANGKQLHPWARVQQEAMDRLSRYSKMAVDCGAEERDVRLAEKWGSQFAAVLEAVVRDLGLTDEQAEGLPDAVRSNLLDLERRSPINLERNQDANN